MNDGCWPRRTSPVGLDIIWTALFITFTHVLLVLVRAVLCSLLAIPVNLQFFFSLHFHQLCDILPLGSFSHVLVFLPSAFHPLL